MSRMAPIALVGVIMAQIGVPLWVWFVLAEAAVLRAAILDTFES